MLVIDDKKYDSQKADRYHKHKRKITEDYVEHLFNSIKAPYNFTQFIEACNNLELITDYYEREPNPVKRQACCDDLDYAEDDYTFIDFENKINLQREYIDEYLLFHDVLDEEYLANNLKYVEEKLGDAIGSIEDIARVQLRDIIHSKKIEDVTHIDFSDVWMLARMLGVTVEEVVSKEYGNIDSNYDLLFEFLRKLHKLTLSQEIKWEGAYIDEKISDLQKEKWKDYLKVYWNESKLDFTRLYCIDGQEYYFSDMYYTNISNFDKEIAIVAYYKKDDNYTEKRYDMIFIKDSDNGYEHERVISSEDESQKHLKWKLQYLFDAIDSYRYVTLSDENRSMIEKFIS